MTQKTAEQTLAALRDCRGNGPAVQMVYTDNSPELIKAVRDFGAAHGVAVPHRPQTNGVAERAVRAVVEGARTLLDQAGMDRQSLAVCLSALLLCIQCHRP